MSSISNRFYIQCMEDGSTLHGQLLSTKSLTQAWSGTAAVPDWDSNGAANRPLIYVDLLNGSTKVTPDGGGKWYYNDTEIRFHDTVSSASIGGRTYWGYVEISPSAGRFFLTGTASTAGNPLGGSPALGILMNLASASNVDIDIITYRGAYTMGGAAVGFAATATAKITGISSSGIFGVIEFVGSNIVTEKNQVVSMVGRLYDASGAPISQGFTTQWYKDGAPLPARQDNTMQISEGDIIDNTIVECHFTYTTGGTTLEYSAYENIDDQTDPEQIYIQHNGGYDNAETVKPGGSSTWYIWVGTQTDSAVDETWTAFYAKLLDGAGNVVTTQISGIPDAETSAASDHYQMRPLPVDPTTHKAVVTVTYDQIRQYFAGYLTAIIIAEK